jgi:GDP-L-fucose synthase
MVIMILEKSHVLPAMIRKFHMTKINNDPAVTPMVLGFTNKREFLNTDDMADACVFLMNTYNEPGLNIGTGKDITIKI